MPKFGTMGGCSSYIYKIVNSDHIKQGTKKTDGILPKDEVTSILEAQVRRTMQPLANITALTNLATGFILLLLCRTNLAKVDVNVGWEL
jgi:hypothetical protein